MTRSLVNFYHQLMFISNISILDIIRTPDQEIKGKTRTGDVKPGLVLNLGPDTTTSPQITITQIDSVYVYFKAENITSEPKEFKLRINESQEISLDLSPEIKIWHITVLGIQEAVKTPSSPSVKIRMPTHYFTPVQDLLKQLETALNSKIIVYYMPRSTQISQDDPEYFLEALRGEKKHQKISLIIHSPGGDSMASYRIANILRQYCEELEIIIPGIATSAATNLALAADTLKFSPLGYLSPIDTQQSNITDERLVKLGYHWISSDSYRRAKELLDKDNISSQGGSSYTELFKYIHPLVVAEVDRLSTKSKLIATKMMKMHRQPFDDNKIESIANHLVYNYPAHGFPILMEEAKKIGLDAEPLSPDIYLLIWDLFKYYQSITSNQITHISTEHYHTERNELLIETVGKRLVRRYSYDRIFSALEHLWQTANDNSSWKKYLPGPTHQDKPTVLPVEIEETDIENPSQPTSTTNGLK